MIQTTIKYPELDIHDKYTFTCKSYQTGKITTKPESYTIHNFAGSWTSKAQQLYDKKRQKFSVLFGKRLGKIISMPYFLLWQLKDNGIRKTLKKTKNKLQK